MGKHSVLVDLCLAHRREGFAGIPQDSRLLFAGLSHSPKLDITGWIYGSNIFESYKDMDKLLSQSLFLGFVLDGMSVKNRFSKNSTKFLYLSKCINLLKAIKTLLTKRYENYCLHSSIDFAQIWRLYFQSTIPYSEFAALAEKKYALTNLTLHRKLFTLYPPVFNSAQYDFVITQDARYVKYSNNTISLIRYHDSLPIFASDTVSNARSIQHHYIGVKKCAKKSIFVCVSPSTVDGLSKLSPEAAEKARVIPCILPKMSRQETDYVNLLDICSAYALNVSATDSNVSVNKDIRNQVAQWLLPKSDNNDQKIPKFIMTLSTIEPRKNHLGLLEAWQKLRRSSGENIKLLIVGSAGWGFDPIISAMKPHIASGHLLHLSKVPQQILPYLYSAATCFIFPSFAEGFGIPPCEAMQCGCPVAVSDHPSHRYSAGDGALYFSPYDTDEMANVLHQLVFSDRNSPFLNDLIEKGYQNVKRFEQRTVLSQWEELFDDLSLKKNSRVSN